MYYWNPFPHPHDNLVPLDEKAGPWCEVPQPFEVARWPDDTEEAKACCLALQGCNNHHSMCESVCYCRVDTQRLAPAASFRALFCARKQSEHAHIRAIFLLYSSTHKLKSTFNRHSHRGWCVQTSSRLQIGFDPHINVHHQNISAFREMESDCFYPYHFNNYPHLSCNVFEPIRESFKTNISEIKPPGMSMRCTTFDD